MAVRNRSFRYLSSSAAIDELEAEAPMKQGIVTILSSDCEKAKVSSLRRTLSADMSSKKWLAQNGFFSPARKMASFRESAASGDDSSSSSSDSDEEESEETRGAGEFWTSVLSQTERKQIQETGEKDVWGSITAKKSENCSNVSAIYVHPLEKQSINRMSDRSLEMCTECIGSETGSDGFCSDITFPDEDLSVYTPKKSRAALFFPPPLSSIDGGDGALFYLQPHRSDGRLILAVLPVPSRNRVRAHRQDGRLILTLTSRQESTRELEQNEVCGAVDDTHDGEVVDNCRSTAVIGGSLAGKKIPVSNVGKREGVISVHKSGLMMALSHIEMDLMEGIAIPQTTLELPPRVAWPIPSKSSPTTVFNVYECLFQIIEISPDGFFDHMITTIMQSTSHKDGYTGNNVNGTKQHDIVLTRGTKPEFFVTNLKGCKESRRPLLMREPWCIATT